MGGFAQDTAMPQTVQLPILVPQKLPHGTEGRPVELIANFYHFTTSDIAVVHYDIDITKDKKFVKSGNGNGNGNGSNGNGNGNGNGQSPTGSSNTSSTSSDEMTTNLERFIKKFSPKIVDKFVADNPALFQTVRHVYDGGKNLYTTKLLDFRTKHDYHTKIELQIDNRPANFNVKLKMVDRIGVSEVLDYYSKKKDTLSERAVSIYEIIFRFIMGKNYEVFQRKFFDLSTTLSSPKVQLAEFVQGFTSGVRMTECGLALNLHLKTSCIIARQITRLPDLCSVLANIGEHKPNRGQIMEVNKFIRHLRMYTEHGQKRITYTMDGIIDKCPRDMTFKNRDGVTTSVADYFMKEYNMQLLQLPLIKTTGKNAKYLPMELCFLVENQFLSNAKINPTIQRELLLKSTNAPNIYFNKLQNVINKVATSSPEIQEEFGIKLETKPVAFTGRVLQTPRQINGETRSKFFSTKPAPTRWAVFCLDQGISDGDLKSFVNDMVARARYFGLNFGPPNPVVKVNAGDPNSLYNVFYNLHQRTQAEFVFVGIPTRKHLFT